MVKYIVWRGDNGCGIETCYSNKLEEKINELKNVGCQIEVQTNDYKQAVTVLDKFRK